MTDIERYLALKIAMREAQEAVLDKAEMSMSKFIDLEMNIESDIPACFETVVGEYEVKAVTKPVYAYSVMSEENGYEIVKRRQYGVTKHIKLHKIKPIRRK